LAALFGDANRMIAFHPVAYPRGDSAGGQDHYVRNCDRAFALRDAALNLFLRIRPRVALYQADTFYQHLAFDRIHLQYPSSLAAIAPGNDLDGVVLLDLHLHPNLGLVLMPRRNSTCHELNHLRRERYDLHEFFLAQFACHRAKHARANRLADFADQHRGIGVEPDVGAVLAPGFLAHPDHHAADYFALLN